MIGWWLKGSLKRRRLWSHAALTVCALATSIGLFVLGAILWTLIARGLSGFSASLFTASTPPPNESGGLANAIYGSFIMTVVGLSIGIPVGMLAGTYLAEYGAGNRFSSVVRFINDVLLSAPSIIVGLFIYAAVVLPMGHFSALAGSFALAVIVIPFTVRTTEDMLRVVPRSLRDASAALGAQPWRTTLQIIYPAAKSGLVTGALLAVARIAGETAPLLFTALNNQFWSTDLGQPMANLPVVIFQFAMSPYHDWQSLAWAGALLITGFVLLLSILARAVSALFGAPHRAME